LLWDLDLISKDMEAQPELWESDYDKIAEIPRKERKRLFFDTLNAQYVFNPGRDDVATLSTDQIWKLGSDGSAPPPPPVQPQFQDGPPGYEGGGGEFGGFNMDMSAAGQYSSRSSIGPVDIAPPRFKITVSGTTPYRGGAQFINQNFMSWLRKYAERKDRPYRIIKDKHSPEMTELRYNNTANVDSRTPVRNEGFEPEFNRPNSRRSTPRDRARPRTDNNTSSATVDLSSILPERPLIKESAEGDYRFTIVWTIELTRPDDARRSEDKIRRERVAERKRLEELEKAKAAAAQAAREAAAKKQQEQKEGEDPGREQPANPAAIPVQPGDTKKPVSEGGNQ